MSTLKISKHLDVPTALDLVKEEVATGRALGVARCDISGGDRK